MELRADGLREGKGGLLCLAGTCSPIRDISIPIPQMQNIDFEGLFGNIQVLISFSKQLLSTLEASDAIGMNSAVTFSQQAGMGFASGRAEQSSLSGRRVSLELEFLPVAAHQSSSEAKEICLAPWIAMLRNTVLVALPGPLPQREPHSSLLRCQLLPLRPWAACAFALHVAPQLCCH